MGLFTKKNHPLTGWLQWQEKLGKLEKGFFEKIGLEELEKDSLFGGAWLEKLDFYF